MVPDANGFCALRGTLAIPTDLNFFAHGAEPLSSCRVLRAGEEDPIMEKCIDIIPHSSGWIYVLDGQPSASYPCYDLALKAARAQAAREVQTLRRPVFRRMEVSGEMTKLVPPACHP